MAHQFQHMTLPRARTNSEPPSQPQFCLTRRPQANPLRPIHGQTVFHSPPLSTQLLNPWPTTKESAAMSFTTSRKRPISAAAGQGAPITPAADWVLFSDRNEHRAILNLGGFSNLTLLPPAGQAKRFRGADLYACNQILDAVARAALGSPYDTDGAAASRGQTDPAAAESLRRLLRAQSELGRSLGSGDECAEWITSLAVSLSPDNLAATAAHSVGRTIRDRVNELAPDARIFLAGGGIHNAALRHAIGTDETTAALGIDPAAREAVCMAVLGAASRMTACPSPPRRHHGNDPNPSPATAGGSTRARRNGLHCRPIVNPCPPKRTSKPQRRSTR